MIPSITLNNGIEIPILGLGLYQSREGSVAANAVEHALRVGYRHFDTAAMYDNERSVGEAIRESAIPRSDIFVTTKLWNSDHGYKNVKRAFANSLDLLGLDYVDLYLIHWPVAGSGPDTWRAMEELLDEGLCRSIGVSNYMVRHLDRLLKHATVVPAVNQFELTPYNYRSRLDVVEKCNEEGIAVEAYSPLTKGYKLGDPKLKAVADKYGKTPAQLLIRWGLEYDFVEIPKSVSKDRIEENADVFDFTISAEDMETLEGFDESLATSWDPTSAP